MTSTTCPCCGSAVTAKLPIIDDNTHTLVYGETKLRLAATHREMMKLLVRRSPGVVPWDTLIAWVYQRDEPEDALGIIKVQLCRLRKLLVGTPIKITTVWNEGLRLEVGA